MIFSSVESFILWSVETFSASLESLVLDMMTRNQIPMNASRYYFFMFLDTWTTQNSEKFLTASAKENKLFPL